jgi:hypothetical protein
MTAIRFFSDTTPASASLVALIIPLQSPPGFGFGLLLPHNGSAKPEVDEDKSPIPSFVARPGGWTECLHPIVDWQGANSTTVRRFFGSAIRGSKYRRCASAWCWRSSRPRVFFAADGGRPTYPVPDSDRCGQAGSIPMADIAARCSGRLPAPLTMTFRPCQIRVDPGITGVILMR